MDDNLLEFLPIPQPAQFRNHRCPFQARHNPNLMTPGVILASFNEQTQRIYEHTSPSKGIDIEQSTNSEKTAMNKHE